MLLTHPALVGVFSGVQDSQNQNTTLKLVLGWNWVIFLGESVFWLLCLPTGQVAEVTANLQPLNEHLLSRVIRNF